jgi:transglutaminase-like putative cysteine protease
MNSYDPKIKELLGKLNAGDNNFRLLKQKIDDAYKSIGRPNYPKPISRYYHPINPIRRHNHPRRIVYSAIFLVSSGIMASVISLINQEDDKDYNSKYSGQYQKIDDDSSGYDSIDSKVLPQNKDYKLVINDDSIKNPFVLSDDMIKIAKSQTSGKASEYDKAKAIFDWIENNIPYDLDKKDAIENNTNHGYNDSLETFNKGSGVCGEQAYLYVSMARSIGLPSNFVSVNRDFEGKEVYHACAAVRVNDKTILADPAYHIFDINHQDYSILTDKKAIELYENMDR